MSAKITNFAVMTTKELHDLLYQGEHIRLECKRATNSVPNSVWETYSAFANTYGGTILLGIHEDNSEKDPAKRFSVCGVEDAGKIRKDLWNMLNNPQKVNVNLLTEDDITSVPIEGKDVVVIKVPQADYLQKPIYISGNPATGTYKRNHEGDYHCTPKEYRMMVRDSNESGNDQMFIEYHDMRDIDLDSLHRYRNIFKVAHNDHVWNELDDKEFLTQLGGYVENRREGTEGLTMAGLLMFGKGLAIRNRFDNLRMDYIDKTDLIGDQRYSDRLTYDGTWENNIFNFMRMVIPKLTRELPVPFAMEGIQRIDDTPQHKAVREAFTNMVTHADLMLDGLLRVEKYDDRFELTNPGLLKLPIEQIYKGGESKARNQRMQNMLRMIGYGENIGSGFPLILKAWSDKHWIEPELVEQPELLQVKLILRLRSTENVTKDVTKELSDRQTIILSLMASDDTITTTEMSQKTGVERRTIQRDIEALQKAGILRREGGRKDGRWVIEK